MHKLHGVATSLLIGMTLVAPIRAADGYEPLGDRPVPVGTSKAHYTTRVTGSAPGHRLISVTQDEADVELVVTDAGGRRWTFDAPGRRISAERACVFDDGRGLDLEIRFSGRTTPSDKSVRLRILGARGRGNIARDSEMEAECLESRAAITRGEDPQRSAALRAADYERAAKFWESQGDASRAAFTYLQCGWMLARRTSDHVSALARGQRARQIFQEARDSRGAALAVLMMTVPRVELLNAGLDSQGRKTSNNQGLAETLRNDLKSAIHTFDAVGESYFGAQARIQLAASHFLKDDLDTAIQLLGEAAERYRKAGEPDGETRALANRSFMIFQRGRYREAAEAFDAVLISPTTRDFPEVMADILDNSATTHSAVGNYDKALSQFVEALRLHEKVNDPAGMARSLNGLASTYLSLGNSRAALEYTRRARSLLEARDTQGRLVSEPARLGSLMIAGEAHRELGDFAAAEKVHREVLSLVTTDLAKARTQLELARDAIGRGDGAGALGALDAAPAVRPGWGTLAKQFDLRRAQAVLISAKPAMAAELLSPLRGQFAQLGAPDLELEVLEALVRVQLNRADIKDALATSDLGVAELKALRLVSGDPETRAQLNDVYRTTYDLRVEILQEMRVRDLDAAMRQRLEAQIFAAADEARAGLARAARTRTAGVTPERASLAAEIALRLKVLAGLEAADASTARAAVLRTELAELRARFDAAAPRPDSLLPIFKESDYSTRGLRKDTAILLYLRSAGQLRRYVMTRSGARELDSRPYDEVAKQADDVFRALSVSPSEIRFHDALPSLRGLSSLLLPPAQLLEGRRQLIVVSDSVTARIPFGALTSNRDEYSPLMVAHDVTMALTLRDALAIGGAPDSDKRIDLSRLALFSDPVFSTLDERVSGRAKASSDVMMLARLSGTITEARAILGTVPASAVSAYSGFGATRDALLSQAGRATVLHLATHAIANDRWPNGSGLLMSAYGSDGSPVNGYVSTLDLQLRGSAAQLVVLSACETARGEAGSGENVAGLARAVLGSGAQRVVASQWAVDDAITARIMRTFYSQLASGISVGRALGEAQRAVYADTRLRSPARWAAFVVYERASGD